MSKIENQERGVLLRKLTLAAIMIAFAVILSQFRFVRMPQAGSSTAFSMLAIVLIGYWCGARVGIIAAIAYGFLQLMFEPYIVHPAQLILDYPLAFGMLGLSGFFKNQKFGLQVGYAVATFGRMLAHFVSGIIFFGAFAPEGQHVWVYSALYQLRAFLPEIILTLVILALPLKGLQRAIETGKLAE